MRAASPWSQLIQDGLRARLELASLITGQLYVGLEHHARCSRSARRPIRPATRRSLRSPSLQYGLQETLTNLLADRPKIEKGLDQMLELLNIMVAGGGAEQITRAMAAATQLLEKMSDPQGPLFETLDRLPPLIADLDQTAEDVAPGPGAGRSDPGCRQRNWPSGQKRPSHDPRRPAGEPRRSAPSWATSCRRWWHRPGHRWRPSPRPGCPACRG